MRLSFRRAKKRLMCRTISLVSDAPMRLARQDPLGLPVDILSSLPLYEYIDVMHFDGSSKLCVVVSCLLSRWFVCRP